MPDGLRKIVDVAVREYRATVLTRAFLFGVVLFPVIIWVIIAVVVPLFDSPDKRLVGTIAVLDKAAESQPVATALESSFDPVRLGAEYDARRAALEEAAGPEGARTGDARQAAKALKKMPEGPAEVQIVRLGDESEIDPHKERVREGEDLALVVVEPDALKADGSYDLFVGRDLNIELGENLRRTIEKAIVDTRLAEAGLDAEQVRALTSRPGARSVTLTESGETESNALAQFILPMGFMMLLWIAVMSSGQYLLTTTIEEKSSRVMELLLSAVSPMQLMTGKIAGQAAVGLTILILYALLGVGAASQFSIMSLVPTERLPWLIVYFVMAYFLIGSLMAAIGSAVNELREAQSLMGVVFIVLMIPMFLWSLIIREPNSTFSVVASMIPPVTPFVMVLRLGQTGEPIPAWQIAASIVIGFTAVVIAVWAAAKIFRVGVLMYGKPPTIGTLIRWIRVA